MNTEPTNGQQTVMIVDDDKFMLKFMADLLENENMQVICCETGTEALRKFENCDVKVALLDINLADYNGLELFKKFKIKRPGVKVIIITGNATLDIAVMAVNEGAFSFFTKPFSNSELINRVQHAFIDYYEMYGKELKKEIKQRKRIEEKQKETLKELQYIDEINRASLAGKPFNATLDIILNALKELFNIELLSLFIDDPENKQCLIDQLYFLKNKTNNFKSLVEIKFSNFISSIKNDSIIKDVIQTGHSHFTSKQEDISDLLDELTNYNYDANFIFPDTKKHRIKTLGIIPLKAGRHLSGLMVFHYKYKSIDPVLIEHIEAFVRHISLAIEKSQNDVQRHQQTLDLAFLKNLHESLNRGDSLDKIQVYCQEQVKRIFQCSSSQIYYYDDTLNTLNLKNINLTSSLIKKIKSLIGIPLPRIFIELRPGKLYTDIFFSGKTHVHSNLKDTYRLLEECIPCIAAPNSVKYKMIQKQIPNIASLLKINNMVNFPLKANGFSLGLFNIYRQYPFSENEIKRLEIISEGITVVLKKKKDEIALINTERKKKAILSAIPDLIFVTDNKGRFLDYHDNEINVLFNEPTKFMGKTILDILPKDVAKPATARIKRICKTQETENFEYSLLINGKTRYYWAFMVPFENQKVLIAVRDITNYKILENKVTESELRYRNVVENQQEFILRLKPDSTITFVNPAYCRFIGHEKDELIGQSILPFFPEELLSQYMDKLHLSARKNQTCPMEYKIVGKNGQALWVIWSVLAIYDEKNNIFELQLVGKDITDHKRAADAMKKSKEFFHSIVEKVGDALYLTDAFGKFIEVNYQACNSLGYSKEELLTLSVSDIDPGFPNEKFSELYKSSKIKSLQTIKSRHRRKDGRLFPVEIRAGIVEIDQEEYLLALARDMTVHFRLKENLQKSHNELEKRVKKRTRQLSVINASLKESEEKYRSLFSDALDMINIIDTDYRIIQANNSELEILGYTKEEYIGNFYFDIVHPKYRAQMKEYLNNVMSGKRGEIYETCLLTKSEEKIYIEIIVTPQLKNNSIVSLRTIARNVTKRVKAEQSMIKVSENEQRRIGSELHDNIGQDLTGIALLTKVFKNKLATDVKPEDNDIKNIIDLINRTISKTRILANGLYPARIEILGIKTALQELSQNIQNLYHVSCKLICNCNIDIGKFDEIHLYRIVQEAISNAIKHGKAKNIVIECKLNTNSIAIIIKDDGIGIQSAKRNGNGLGFYIMENRAKMIGASLHISGEAGNGTIVRCSIKRQEKEHDARNNYE